jgi:mannose/cellobiose epimerase-like protein (N-acyl-D-glucosamine 2-epimerase family)
MLAESVQHSGAGRRAGGGQMRLVSQIERAVHRLSGRRLLARFRRRWHPDTDLRTELETELRRLVGTWFPRSVDREHGGFLCDFDHRWRPAGAQVKMLEYQARQTLAAARAAGHSPDLAPRLREAAAHGFRYLRERLWDHRLGGWYRLLDRTGAPLEGATKHGHGAAYAISACVACYRLTRDPACLELAQLAFSWLDEHAHDDRHGGYFAFYQPDGTPILSPEQGPSPAQIRDPIGTPVGFKDANTTSDLLQGFSDLYRVWPDPRLRTRLLELVGIVRDRLVVAPGVMHHYAHPDWTPLPDFVRYGQVLRSANYLLSASDALGGAGEPATGRVAKSMVDAMLRIGWDRDRGGFHLAGSSFGLSYVEYIVVFERLKPWWAQADGMRVLLAMARRHPAQGLEYEAHFVRLWEYVRRYVVDATHGGWYAAGLDSDPAARKRPKATAWKDASHEIEAMLDCLSMLDPTRSVR